AGVRIGGIDRFCGILNGPNDLGGLMLITVGAALVCWDGSSRRQRLLLALTIAAAAIFCAIADSRSAFVAVGAGCALYLIWKKGLRGILICGGGLALAAAAALAIDPGLFAYIGRGNVGTLTGRTDIWAFAIKSIKERPLLGYGYEVSGAIFKSKYFPLWWGPWNYGPHSSLHDGYLGHAVGVGIPAAMFWMYIVMRPWFFVFRQDGDPWRLKSIFFLVAVPILVNNLSEQILGDFAGSAALLFGLSWALAERYRLVMLERAATEEKENLSRMPRAMAALTANR
ncbi:MAG: O-antigen ligase family protein, partial [Candidatus Binataceae bacterium]